MTTAEGKKHLILKHGVVVGDKMDKTVTVRVDRTLRHPQYEKIVTRGKKYYAHDEKNECKVGDKVTIVQSRPYSKLKRWCVMEKQSTQGTGVES